MVGAAVGFGVVTQVTVLDTVVPPAVVDVHVDGTHAPPTLYEYEIGVPVHPAPAYVVAVRRYVVAL